MTCLFNYHSSSYFAGANPTHFNYRFTDFNVCSFTIACCSWLNNNRTAQCTSSSSKWKSTFHKKRKKKHFRSQLPLIWSAQFILANKLNVNKVPLFPLFAAYSIFRFTYIVFTVCDWNVSTSIILHQQRQLKWAFKIKLKFQETHKKNLMRKFLLKLCIFHKSYPNCRLMRERTFWI